MTTLFMPRHCCILFITLVVSAGTLMGQLGPSARRVLGQPDLRQNGFNSLEGVELFAPSSVALDERDAEVHVYVVDRLNSRVLAWRDLTSLESGASADLVLGQIDFTGAARFGIGVRSFVEPSHVAVNPSNGDVYVSDDGAHRVTRFQSPFSEGASLEPDKVYGQENFGGVSANPGGVGAGTFRDPAGLTFDADGNLWVADVNNHRVLRYSATSLDDDDVIADIVIGQFDFGSASLNAGVGVSSIGLRNPTALAVDSEGSLYVADSSNSRVVVFRFPQSTAQAASRVIGQESFSASSASGGAQAWSLRRVNGLAISASGSLYAAMREDHRVLIFDEAATAIGRQDADAVVGQLKVDGALSNTGSSPKASESGLSSPGAVAVAPDGTILIADTGNNRVTVYREGPPAASVVLGQPDAVANSANRVGSVGIGGVYGVVLDYSTEGFPVYAADTLNHRVLAWRSSLRFANGAPADLVIGQLGFEVALANRGSTTPSQSTLDSPRGIAITSAGDLFVADSGNNRILRFRRPFDQNGLAGADLVLGQSVFFTRTSAFVNAASMNNPSDVEIGPEGRVYVSDTGNNRVLEFASNASNGIGAERVFGKPDFQTGTVAAEVSAETLDSPLGIAVSDIGTLYVADENNHRILLFPLGPGVPSSGSSASIVVGQITFETRVAGVSATALRDPADVAVSLGGAFFVADAGNHRVIEYRGGLFFPTTGGAAIRVLGQSAFNRRTPNYNSADGRATAEGLVQPSSVFADRNGMVYVGDVGNNRVVEYLRPAVAVSAATFAPAVGVAAGSLSSLFGFDLSPEIGSASDVPLPTELGGVIVEVGNEGKLAPLVFVSPGQINMQIPPSTAIGIQQLWIRRSETDELIGGGLVSVSATRPGLFTYSQTGTGFAVAVNEDGSLNGPLNPAPRGSVLILYGTGQGPTSPTVGDGEAPPNGVLTNTVATPTDKAIECVQSGYMCVLVGSKVAETLFSGLAPGFVGLWQVNVRMPSDENFLGGLQVPLKILIDQITTNDDVFISVQ